MDGLARIVEDLRTLGLFNAGALELSIVPLDLADIAREVIQLYEQELAVTG